MKQFTATVLCENTAEGMGRIGEHGLAFWIETSDRRVLFDTGQGLALAHNAGQLEIDLDRTDAIVISHGHRDHTGGLAHAMNRAPTARLFLDRAALAVRFSCRDGMAAEIGMPSPARLRIERGAMALTWTHDVTEIAPGVFATGRIPRRNDFEDTGGPFFLDSAAAVLDGLPDDQALWIETDEGLVVLLGCAHAGVVNTLDHIRDLAGGRRIRTVAGGMHLGSASPVRMARTIESLKAHNLEQLCPCHCTGVAATARLMAVFGDRCRPLAVGARIA